MTLKSDVIGLVIKTFRVSALGVTRVSDRITSTLPEIEVLWGDSLGDPSICIAFLDGRVDREHSCFNGAEVVEVAPVWIEHSLNMRGSAHGTHVASIVLGQHGSLVEGIAPRCR